MTAHGHEGPFWEDGNVVKLDYADGYTILKIYWKSLTCTRKMNFIVYKLHLNKAIFFFFKGWGGAETTAGTKTLDSCWCSRLLRIKARRPYFQTECHTLRVCSFLGCLSRPWPQKSQLYWEPGHPPSLVNIGPGPVRKVLMGCKAFMPR